jgi:hypothetical protein
VSESTIHVDTDSWIRKKKSVWLRHTLLWAQGGKCNYKSIRSNYKKRICIVICDGVILPTGDTHDITHVVGLLLGLGLGLGLGL